MNVSANHYNDHESSYRNASCMSVAQVTEHGQVHYPSQMHDISNASVHSNPGLLYHSHLLEYGITTSSSPILGETYYDTSPYNTNTSSYSSTNVPSSVSPDHHNIISSDNGLSYTNLDYMYSGPPNAAYPYNPDDRLRMSQQYDHISQCNYSPHTTQNPSWLPQHTIQTHSHAYQNALDNASGLNPALLDSSGDMKQLMDSGQFMNKSSKLNYPQQPPPPQYSTTKNGSDPSGEHHASNVHQTSNTQTTSVPTYKWMQVKRNVPKPQSK